MAIFRRSLAEDAIDRYNHTWAVMLFLVLALITWLLPLSPLLQPQLSSLVEKQESAPQYKASCWCPIEFTSSHISYTNFVCGMAFDLAMSGKQNNLPATLNHRMSNDVPISFDTVKASRFMPSMNNASKEEIEELQAARAKTVSAIKNLVVVKTPLVLFVFALCFKLPNIIWALLSSCAGINIHGTLEAVRQGQALQGDSRRQLKQELVQAVSESVKRTSSSTSLIYLMAKFLACVVAVTGLLVVHNYMLLEVKVLQSELGKLYMANSTEVQYTGMTDDVNDVAGMTSLVLLCDFEFQQLSNVKRYTVQCLFTPDDADVSRSPWSYTTIPLGIYESLYNILLAFLLTLAIVNVLNLLTWAGKLTMGACRRRVTSNSELPVDALLLLHMAQDNVGHLAASDLADGFAGATRTGRGDEAEQVKLSSLND